MSRHDLLVLTMATTFMIANLLGAALTIGHLRSKRIQRTGASSTAASQHSITLGASESVVMYIKFGRFQASASGLLAVPTIVAIFVLGLVAATHLLEAALWIW
jgi:hypothetical protein